MNIPANLFKDNIKTEIKKAKQLLISNGYSIKKNKR